MIRLSDGAVLSSAKGMYWRTGELAGEPYRLKRWPGPRTAASPSKSRIPSGARIFFAFTRSRRTIRCSFSTYKSIIEPAVRKRLRQLSKNDGDYTFSVAAADGSLPTVDDSGLVRVPVLMQIPKHDGYLYLDVTLQVSQKNGALSAGDVSVRRSRTKS